MMKFEIIVDEAYAVPNAGYELDFSHGCYKHNLDYYNGSFAAPSNEVKSFYALDGAALCKGEDGNLYAVEFARDEAGKLIPVIWQRVKKSA